MIRSQIRASNKSRGYQSPIAEEGTEDYSDSDPDRRGVKFTAPTYVEHSGNEYSDDEEEEGEEGEGHDGQGGSTMIMRTRMRRMAWSQMMELLGMITKGNDSDHLPWINKPRHRTYEVRENAQRHSQNPSMHPWLT